MVLRRTPNTRPPPERAEEAALVTVSGYFYLVDLGPDASPRVHHVGKDRRCACPQGSACRAVSAVAAYLKAGGERAPDPPSGYFPVAPRRCPICSAEADYAPNLSSRQRGAGWRCSSAGGLHYWQAHIYALRAKLAANPWLFPPVVVRNGVRIQAYEGLQSDDLVLYSGVRREEVITQE